MSSGFFFSNPSPHQGNTTPINNNGSYNTNGGYINNNGGGQNGGFNNMNGYSNSGNLMQQQQHFNQQNFYQQNQPQQQHFNQQQQFQVQQQQQISQNQQLNLPHQQFNQHQQQMNQQQLTLLNNIMHSPINNMHRNQVPNPLGTNIGGGSANMMNSPNINVQQNQVPNPLWNTSGGNANVNDAAPTSLFRLGNLFNLNNFFNSGTNNSSTNNSSNLNMMNDGCNFANTNSMMTQQGNLAVQAHEVSTTPLSQIESYNHTGNPSPVPMAFMTPRMGLSPSQTPNPPTPLVTARMGMTPNPSDSPAPPLGSLNDMMLNNRQDMNSATATSFSPRLLKGAAKSEKAAPAKKSSKAAAASAIANAQKSFFRRGITQVGSALGVVANYINQSLLSGIPFHIADRAMRESKLQYAKWWDDGINDGNVDDEAADENTGEPSEKRRKVGSGEAVDVPSPSRGSALSASLEKNYNAMGIDTKVQVSKPHEVHHQKEYSPSMPYAKPMNVDSSIIKHRRSQFDHSKKESSFDGYDIFNSIDCMYGGGIASEQNIETSKVDYDEIDPTDIFSTNNVTITSSSTIDGTMNAIKELFEEKNNAQDESEIYQMIASPREFVTRTLRSELIDALQSSQGDTNDKRFLSSLEVLNRFFKSSGRDARVNPWSVRKVTDESGDYGYCGAEVGGPLASDLLEGSWLNMSRPNYVECLGNNKEGDFMYTLGRMSFDMFQPGDLICSVQSTHNNIRIVGEQEELPAFVPKSLKEEVASLSNSDGDSTSKRPLLRSYDIAVSMTLEPPASVGQPEPSGTPTPTKRLRAIMAVKGYVLPDPNTPNRLTVWFTGGKLCPAKLASNDNDDSDEEDDDIQSRKRKSKQTVSKKADDDDVYGGFAEWTALFSKGKWRKTLGERARAMAAKLLLGADIPNKMEDDGHMEYSLHRPVGGHSKVYVEVMYLDEDILIMRGHRGTIYAMARSCVSQRYRNIDD